jgi:hypothetical protein
LPGGRDFAYIHAWRPLLIALRQTTWAQTALPLLAGLLLAYGLGLGRGSR